MNVRAISQFLMRIYFHRRLVTLPISFGDWLLAYSRIPGLRTTFPSLIFSTAVTAINATITTEDLPFMILR